MASITCSVYKEYNVKTKKQMQCGKQAAWKKKKGNKTFYFCDECAKATYQLQEVN